MDEKYSLIEGIKYGDQYHNSYLEIITPSGDFASNRPTYFYVHGGGFIGGSSLEGNPNAGAEGNATLYQ